MRGGSDRVEVDGRKIAFECKGAGAPLVLLHGVLGDSRDWSRQLDSLSDDFTVVAWDAPGCGESADPPEHFGLADYADALAGFILALGIERPHVLGLSFGSGLAIELFRRHRELTRSLVLASAYAGWAGSLPPEVVAERLERGLLDADLPPDEVAREFSKTLFETTVPAEIVDEVIEIMADFHPAGLRAMARAFAHADLRDVLPLMDVPTLLLYGDADRRAPPDVAAALHRQIPGSELVLIPGVGHMTNIEAPERFDHEVRRFLHGVPGSA